jgi:hypothetical protein
MTEAEHAKQMLELFSKLDEADKQKILGVAPDFVQVFEKAIEIEEAIVRTQCTINAASKRAYKLLPKAVRLPLERLSAASGGPVGWRCIRWLYPWLQ